MTQTEQIPGDESITAPPRTKQSRGEKQLEVAAKAVAKEQEIAARRAERSAKAALRAPLRRPLSPDRIVNAATVRAEWEMTIPDDVPPSTWLDPAFLKHLAKRAHVRDKVTIWNDSGTYRMEALVIEVEPALDKITCRVWAEREVQPRDVGEDETLGAYSPSYLSLHDGWGVVRNADGVVMKKNLPTKREAIYLISTEFNYRPVS